MSYIDLVLCFHLAALLLAGWKARRSSWTGRLALAAAAGLFLWSWIPVAAGLSYTLERWYPVRAVSAEEAGAIVVLAAGVRVHDAAQPRDEPRERTYLRCGHAAWLYRTWRRVPVLASGGESGGVVHAQVMARILEEQGVPRNSIWTEERSRSTYENALYSAELLRAKGVRRIVLVTEAQHMLRSAACFRRQGIDAVPAPCAYRHITFHPNLRSFFPAANAIAWNEDTFHEWVGLAWYKLSGKI